ncbi:hypothetical protein [Stieleria tagensis]|uniref:hypothetical protein n=1 Tax=Stieleria tagensis TaxID=2956795 RepID=UPI00209ABBB6|nr:hypothetical protein [Stieleria tagensis]
MTGILLAVLAGGVLWWWPRSPVVLDDNSYQMTIALYRICNQKSEPGLKQLERQFAELDPLSQADQASYQLIAATIADAKAGRWVQAMQQCRQSLDDQVSR